MKLVFSENLKTACIKLISTRCFSRIHIFVLSPVFESKRLMKNKNKSYAKPHKMFYKTVYFNVGLFSPWIWRRALKICVLFLRGTLLEGLLLTVGFSQLVGSLSVRTRMFRDSGVQVFVFLLKTQNLPRFCGC